jgi:hypothetical protein
MKGILYRIYVLITEQFFSKLFNFTLRYHSAILMIKFSCLAIFFQLPRCLSFCSTTLRSDLYAESL